MIRAVVLAAGASSRMGRAKAALPLGRTGETVLGRVIRTLLDGGVPDVTVVAGAHVDAVHAAIPAFAEATAGKPAFAKATAGTPDFAEATAGRPGAGRARVIEHAGWRQGQLSSLLAGLAAIDDAQLEAALVTLVDVPLVKPSTVAAVMAEWRRTRAPIVRPAQGDRHGHPVIFDRSVFQDLRDADPEAGAKAVFAKHRDRIINVDVDDPGAFMDMDTVEQYEDFRSRIADC